MPFRQLAPNGKEPHVVLGGSACRCLAQPHSAEEDFTLDCGPFQPPPHHKTCGEHFVSVYMIIGQFCRQG